MSRFLSIWAVSDGRVGIENQAVGLAEAVSRLAGEPAQVIIKRVSWRPPFDRLPTKFNLLPLHLLAVDADDFEPPWPDVWIAAGRASLPLSLRMRRWSKGRTLVVQLQDPRWPPKRFDLVVPPMHDDLEGPNVLPILGSPNRITPDRLAQGLARFQDKLAALPPGPRIALLIGGDSRSHALTVPRAAQIAKELNEALDRETATLLISFSRRTPRDARRILTEKLEGRGWIWDGTGENPYLAFLAAADLILVTQDSVNMATDAATAGKPILVLPIDGGSHRIRRFHEALAERGIARPFQGQLEPWPVLPLEETERAAAEVVRLMRARGV